MNRTRPSLYAPALSAPARLIACGATLALGLFALACDSGTQEPAAPTPAAPEASEAAAPEAAAPAPTAREGEIDSSRFPTELPEGATASIPDNFPSDLPVYPKSQPAQGKGVEIEGSPQSVVQFLTNDVMADVHKFYSAELLSKGWTIGEDAENQGGASIQASKDKCKAQILITPAEGGGSDIVIVTEC